MTATGTFIFICSACGYKARLPEEFSGKTIKCPGCQAAQLAKAQVNTERKTASFTRVAATPMPFTLPKEQEEVLAQSTMPVVVPAAVPAAKAVAVAQATTPKSFPSPLPGAIQVTSDRIAKAAGSMAPAAKPAATATIDFGCSSCYARMRLPAHYEGKSILCPKCSAPQKVLTTLPEPMDTTRAVVREGERPHQVRVTPLPRTYPTPLPTAAPTAPGSDVNPLQVVPVIGQPTKPHIGELSSIKDLTSFPAKTPPPPVAPIAPTADSMAGMTMAISAPATEAGSTGSVSTGSASADPELGSSTDAFSKPHPSRGKVPTVAVRKSADATPGPGAGPTVRPPTAAYAKPQRSPIGLIVALGLLGLLVIGLGAAAVSFKLSLNEAHARQQTAEGAASSAAQREQTASAQIKDLTEQIEALELKLKAAATEVPAPVAEPATPPAEPATPPTTEPAQATPETPAVVPAAP